VLKRPEQREVSGLTLAQVDAALAALAAAIEPVEVRFGWRPQLRDSDDELVLDAAVNGQADALVTHNVAGRFCRRGAAVRTAATDAGGIAEKDRR
jgi:predicted nucleic acid-binding protein